MNIMTEVMPYITELADLMRHWDDGVVVKEGLLKEEIETFINEEHGHFFLAFEDAQLVGYAVVCITTEPLFGKRCELQQLLVHPAHRRKGIATELMQQCNDYAGTQQCRTLWLSSRLHLEEAHQFYESLGFQEVKCSKVFEKPLSGIGSSLFSENGSLYEQT